jgi:hypothetical protein
VDLEPVLKGPSPPDHERRQDERDFRASDDEIVVSVRDMEGRLGGRHVDDRRLDGDVGDA